MALADHLREFRNRLGISLLGLFVGVVVAFIFWEPIYHFLSQPYCSTSRGRRTATCSRSASSTSSWSA